MSHGQDTVDAFDAIVVGSGINAMVASAELAGAGWRVCLLEANQEMGGFIASGELTAPGFVHDTFSSWHPLFVTGGAYAELGSDLARHGLRYRNTDEIVTGSVADDGRTTLAWRDPVRTAQEFAAEADRDAYLKLLNTLGADLDELGALLGSELRSVRSLLPLARMARRGRAAGVERRLRDVAASGRAKVRSTFVGPEVDHLWAPWLLHAGLGPDNASGGLMLALLAGTMHAAGLPVVEGGASRFIQAFASLLAERRVQVRTGCPVTRVLVEDGRAAGVCIGDEQLRAGRAVLASVSPRALYTNLLPAFAVSVEAVKEAAGYRPGRAAMQVHVSLSGPPAWRDIRLADVPLVHLTDGSSSTGIACAEAEAGLLPRRPTVVVGQQHVLDPSRVPAGCAALWIQLQEVPYVPVGDAAGTIDTAGLWSPEVVTAYVDRVLRRVARHAPGVCEQILGQAVLTPVDLETANRNAERGDPYGGSAELDQNLLWRPGPVTSRHRTAIPGLWHIGASTHPGPGLSGGSGHLVAQSLTARRRGLLRSGAA